MSRTEGKNLLIILAYCGWNTVDVMSGSARSLTFFYSFVSHSRGFGHRKGLTAEPMTSRGQQHYRGKLMTSEIGRTGPRCLRVLTWEGLYLSSSLSAPHPGPEQTCVWETGRTLPPYRRWLCVEVEVSKLWNGFETRPLNRLACF